MGWGERWPWRVDRVPPRAAGGSAARRTLSLALLVLQGVFLVSCGGEPLLVPPGDPLPAATNETSELAPATPVHASTTPDIGAIIWTTATEPVTNAPVQPVSSYLSDAPRITAAAPALSLLAGSRVQATWEYNNTSLDAFTTRIAATGGAEETWVTFHIDRDPDVPWPLGEYEVTISLDDVAMQHAMVEVIGAAGT